MIIIDTNVIVSGLLTRDPAAPTARLLNAVITGEIRPLLSPALVVEYRTVLVRPRIKTLHGLEETQIDALLADIIQHSMWREPANSGIEAPDTGDNHLWDLLYQEPTALLVTGDLRLLDTPPFDTRVIRVRDFELGHNQGSSA